MLQLRGCEPVKSGPQHFLPPDLPPPCVTRISTLKLPCTPAYGQASLMPQPGSRAFLQFRKDTWQELKGQPFRDDVSTLCGSQARGSGRRGQLACAPCLHPHPHPNTQTHVTLLLLPPCCCIPLIPGPGAVPPPRPAVLHRPRLAAPPHLAAVHPGAVGVGRGGADAGPRVDVVGAGLHVPGAVCHLCRGEGGQLRAEASSADGPAAPGELRCAEAQAARAAPLGTCSGLGPVFAEG